MNDGVAHYEAAGMAALGNLAKQDLSLTRQLLDYTLTPAVTAIDVLLIDTIEEMRYDHPRGISFSRSNPGTSTASTPPNARSSLGYLELRLSSSSRIPIAASIDRLPPPSCRYPEEITLWAFDFRPLPEGEDVLEMAAEAARELERFMGIPFPIDTIIFKFSPTDFLGFPALAGSEYIDVSRASLPNLDRSDERASLPRLSRNGSLLFRRIWSVLFSGPDITRLA